MADFSRAYLRRVKQPLFSKLGSSQAKSLLFEVFCELNLSPFNLSASDYHILVTVLEERLEQRQLVNAKMLSHLKGDWSVDSVTEIEVLGDESETSSDKEELPSEPESLCEAISDAAISGSLAGFRLPSNPSPMQQSVLQFMQLVLNTISTLKEQTEGPEVMRANELVAAQLERYERITAFSRQINTLDMEYLRKKLALLPYVLGVEDVAVLVFGADGLCEPFYVSVEGAESDLGMSMLLASLAEETVKRCGVISGFEPEFASSYQDVILDAGFSSNWLAIPLLIEDVFLGAVIVFDDSNDLYTEDEVNVIVRVCNHMASALQSCLQHKNVGLLRQRLDDELQGVGSVQEKLLPQTLPKTRGCEIAAFYKPSGRASGDYYDVKKISDTVISFMVADVSGHGAPAAVVMAMCKTAFRLFLKQHLPISKMLPQFNDFLCSTLNPEMFVTAVAGRIDIQSGVLEYVSAGHCPAILIRGATGKHELLTNRDVILGVLPNQTYNSTSVPLRKGDRLVFYTDGVTEAVDEDGSAFGTDMLIETIENAPSLSAEELIGKIVTTVIDFMGSVDPDDDITLLVFSF
ncbi:SpoIIE family protein phosphatase [bacterium]|nr:SpoIIE family protein phosphatase [bacterium]